MVRRPQKSSEGNSEQMWLFSPKKCFFSGFPYWSVLIFDTCGLHVVFFLLFFFHENTVSSESTMTTSLSEWGSVLITWEKTLSYCKSDSAVQWDGRKEGVHSRTPCMNFLAGFNHLNMFKDKVQHVASSESISADNPVVWSWDGNVSRDCFG